MYDQQYPLYHPELEHESCGVGAIADLSGRATHRTVDQALTIVERLAHRAGSDALGTTGDGVGIMTRLPHEFFTAWAREEGINLGKPGDYGVGMFFLPEDEVGVQNICRIFDRLAAAEGIPVLGWRDVPCHPAQLGAGARRTMPRIRQCFLKRPAGIDPGADFDRKLYVLRRVFEKQDTDTYICSLSSRTIVYKGMMLVSQLRSFYDDLQDVRYVSQMAMVHSRFSTNTFPSWSKAHPQRMLLHNGEINTIRGNHDRMKAREETMRSAVMGDAMKRVLPVVDPDGSDSQMLDNTLEFLAMNGFPLPLAGMVLLPEPWQGEKEVRPWRDLYRYYATMMEPWDGPAAILYSDGDSVCASLDRNGLRPLRCALTDDRRLILSSEAGVLFEENAHIRRRWKLKGGDVLMADLQTGELLESDALKSHFAALHPYGEWVKQIVRLGELPPSALRAATSLGEGGLLPPSVLRAATSLGEGGLLPPSPSGDTSLKEGGQIAPLPEGGGRRPGGVETLCKAFGYAFEDIHDVILPMASTGGEPIVSMGADGPMAALSKAHPPLFDYFKQRFAQVTNPPIDALREVCKTDCSIYIGDDGNLLSHDAENCAVLELPSPVLTGEELRRIREIDHPAFKVREISLLYPVRTRLRQAMRTFFAACDAACRDGVNILILSDRGVDADQLAIPSLLAVSALEQHLIHIKKRTAVSVLLESGEPRDTHQLAMLIAYGARAVNPYLAHDIIRRECGEAGVENYNKALTAGVLKIASKMGVSTLQAYQSAQLFEAVGLDAQFVDQYFTNTPCTLGGKGLHDVEADSRHWHDAAFQNPIRAGLPSVGRHRLRSGDQAEEHLYSPEVIHLLQQAVWTNDRAKFDAYAARVEHDGPRTIRASLDFRYDLCNPIPIEEVEPVEQIVKRFRTGAMSYGSISKEAHECMAEAMNRLGGRSNSGEGGELKERFGTDLNSAIKQVASGRFGVTRDYLLSAKEIQIKMAQGAKPGEGGHLPGAKVTESVAKTRCATPGISLISPPPHHDIYSIEDLAELIYDLQCANEDAKVTVKLVSSTGVGTIASGVAKAGAGGILISGGEGGTGAAPMSSVHHAGLPWEIGLAETHQVLCRNRLRQTVTLETDGKLMSGHDVAVALLLGAEQFGFATAPLITMGCRMMRVCHLGTCPFGVATQNPELRRRFVGRPEYVERFMIFIAEQLREIMARLGARTVDELVGRSDLLKMKEGAPIDLSDLIGFARNIHVQPESRHDFALNERADARLIQNHVHLTTTDRAFGTLLKGERHIQAQGCGGQSFGAFLPKGQSIALYGVANDYLGKGLSGGTLAICPPADAVWNQSDTLIGNVALYGATSGYAFIAGTAGERFAVRNSGAWAVVEGVGDHGCEYMTGGRVAVLGPVGDNFGAGMSGGIAWVLDEAGTLESHINSGLVRVHAVTPEQAAELRQLLEMHARHTDSRRTADILADFDAWLTKFRAVISDEYLDYLNRRV